MTPPAASAAARSAARTAGRHGARTRGPALSPATAAPALPRISVRLPRPRAGAASGALRRVRIGGRGWIAVFALALLGLVFLQVSLLKLNAAISVNVERAQVLERGNSELRGTISRQEAGRRIEDVAAQLGMVLPGAGAVCYLDAKSLRPCSGGDVAAAASATDPLADTTPTDPTAQAAQATLAADPATGTDPATSDQQAATQAPVEQQQQQQTTDQSSTPDQSTTQAPSDGGATPAEQDPATSVAPADSGVTADPGTGGVSAAAGG